MINKRVLISSFIFLICVLRKPKCYIKGYSSVYLKRVCINEQIKYNHDESLCYNCLYHDGIGCTLLLSKVKESTLYRACTRLTPANYSGKIIYVYAEKEKTIP